MRPWILAAGLLVSTALSMACGSDDAGGGSPVPSPTPGLRVVDAPIDEAELIIRESFPPQYAVRVVSGIPDGCHAFNGVMVQRTDPVIEINVTNTVVDADDVACTQEYGTHEEVIELGSDFDAGVTYTVKVNDRELTFVGEGRP